MAKGICGTHRAQSVLRAAAAGLLLAVAMHSAQAAVVATQTGQVRGVPADAAGGVTVYRGIPYAAPPTGESRWREPRPPIPWSGIRDASVAAPGCMQGEPKSLLPWTAEFLHHGGLSEDCLYLNLWTPAHAAGDRLPVLVFIHGGAFTSGSGSVPLYDGTALARRKLIVVTINYRLGAFGFLAHPALTRESVHHASGNYGLMDQVAALRWVHANVAAFGGDPEQVTIAGQSAGAMSVYLLMVSPQAKGLFQRAIVESGPGALAALGVATGRAATTPLQAAEGVGADFASRRGATTAAELRALGADRLLARPDEGNRVHFGPVVDGWFLPVDPDTAIAAHAHSDVPLLVGMMADEPSAFAGYDASKALASRAQAVHALDGLLAAWARNSTQPVYAYYFEHPIPWPEHPQFGAFHSGELPYVFDNLAILDRPWSAVDRRLALAASSYWARFVGHGNPAADSLPAWRAYRPGSLEFMVFGDRAGMRAVPPEGSGPR
ncbi:MAG TPA: carboxylesterase family protein [Steroidobacteraceae bacterium]|nr:carboxylesterase family protein [Steroidobacteraceae bacterium]